MNEIKKIINIRVVLCFVSLVGILALSYGTFRLFVKMKLDVKTTYVASHSISPRTIISENDLLEVEVANAYLINNAYIDKSEIIGKITDIQGTIPAGSPFYKTMLYEVDKINDQATSLLKEGQTAYTMNTEMYKVSSFTIGNRVDLYLSLNDKDNPLTGRILKNVRILSIKDNHGLSIENEESTGIPYYIELAINENDISWLTLAESVGDIRLFLSSNQTNPNLEAELDEESETFIYLSDIKNKEEKEDEKEKEEVKATPTPKPTPKPTPTPTPTPEVEKEENG